MPLSVGTGILDQFILQGGLSMSHNHDPYSFSEELALPVKEKLPKFSQNGKLFHIILSDQFYRQDIDLLCRLADILQKIASSVEGAEFMRGLLSQKSAMLYFTQPSTRTFLSFVRACQYLGINYAEVRDPRVSSSYKGESDIDGVRTFSNYFDLIIMRHHEAGFAERVAYLMNKRRSDLGEAPLPVISGGSGQDEHPTQALLDLYTINKCITHKRLGADDFEITFIGDVARGRTVRSLVQMLTKYPKTKINFVSPEELRIKDNLRSYLERNHQPYLETDSLEEVLRESDVVYVTRIQDEYDENGESRSIDYSRFHLTLEHVERMLQNAIVMHPLPRRHELDPRIDDNHRAKYWIQEKNGMWIRAALIAYILNAEGKILDYFNNNYNY